MLMKTSITFLYLFLFSLLSSLWTLSEASDIASSLKLERTVKQHDENSNLFFELQGDPLTDASSFITTWKISSSNDSIAFNVRNNYQYSYDVYWEKVGQPSVKGNSKGNKGAFYKTKLEAGEYKVAISGVFPYFSVSLDYKSRARENIIAINQWGTQKWKSMNSSFAGAKNLELKATDTPNLTEVEDMYGMFVNAINFTGDLNNWDVSNVTNFSYMFSGATSFNRDLNNWDVSSGRDFSYMFKGATSFNGDLNNWDVSNVTKFSYMFSGATSFNRDLNNWDVSSGRDFSYMFYGATSFNQDISSWDVSSGRGFSSMFNGATSFNQDISSWDVSSGRDFSYMFYGATSFNQDISGWDVSKGTDFYAMFFGATSFDGNISSWDVSSGTDFSYMFYRATSFNQDISSWDVSSGRGFSYMFSGATSFNRDLNNWDVSSGRDFSYMFYGATSFNQDISGWDVSSGTNFSNMFNRAISFNRDLNNWDVSNGRDFRGMFYRATSFDGNISSWDVSKSAVFYGMFYAARSFSQDLSKWDISQAKDLNDMFSYSGMQLADYDKILKGWASLATVPNNIKIGVVGLNYCLSKEYRDQLEGKGWEFVADKYDCINSSNSFILEWDIDEQNTAITILTNSSYNYHYTVAYQKIDNPQINQISSDVTGNYTSAVLPKGRYKVSIRGEFPHFRTKYPKQLRAITQWGTQQWKSMNSSFLEAVNLELKATDTPNLTEVEDMYGMFSGAKSFNGYLNNWDVSNVTNFSEMFSDAINFNGNLSNWDVSSGTDFYAMFYNAKSFNGDLNNWDVSKGTDFNTMFSDAKSFNGDLSNWDVSSGTDFYAMFSGATSFNQDISGWDVSKGTDFYAMFNAARSFSQDLSKWDISQAEDLDAMFSRSGMQLADYDKTLKGWASLPTVPKGIMLGAEKVYYCSSEQDRETLIKKYNWEIYGDIKLGSDLVLKDKKVQYNGEEHSIEIKNLPSDQIQVEYIIYDEHKQEVKQAIDAGKYTVEAIIKGCSKEQRIKAFLTITKKPIRVTALGAIKKYDGIAYKGGHGLFVEGILEQDLLVDINVTYVGDSQGAVNIGTYMITPTELSLVNYQVTQYISGTLTIEKAELIGVELKDTVYRYDGELKSLAISGDIDIVTDVRYLNNSHSDVGEYKVEAKVLAGDNYHPLSLEGTLTIEKAE
ncbi:BspA family leucine-rich repeat surface protein, partial [Myroides sp. LoEW2-1]|nr:BspA family leucine-rich repeat surface protein [Myroides sp. LoEW2-1]